MRRLEVLFLAVIVAVMSLSLGFSVGSVVYNKSLQKQVTLLSIELTKLEIKKLKELSND